MSKIGCVTFSTSASRLSGLQKEVLSLYRTVLRLALKKDRDRMELESVSSVLSLMKENGSSLNYARAEFHKQAHSIKRSDFRTIEYSIRKGKKHIKLLEMPGVKVVGGSK